ncbi:MAG: CopG family transcriptional regulator [Cyanobium sp. PLM2.Bin73]|nr:MAG: CopG family transcriptional regulator [Cyanobium sp. PLM2.Bin73]
MRTTLTLDDDVLAAARVLARQQRQPIGSVISALARQALATPPHQPAGPAQARRNGLPLLPLQPGGAPVDLELVNQLRDEAP